MISKWIAKIGENPKFIAFMAHSGFACSVVLAFKGKWWIVVAGIMLALIKEFYWDRKFEQTPPQTFLDSLDDFTGYMVGIGVALLIANYFWAII